MAVSDLSAAGLIGRLVRHDIVFTGNAYLLIEKDVNSDVTWVWSYPTVDEDFREMLIRKCCLSSDKEASDSAPLLPFIFGHFGRTWYYLLTETVEDQEVLPKVTNVTMVLLAKVKR
jgi:hypothetical protein